MIVKFQLTSVSPSSQPLQGFQNFYFPQLFHDLHIRMMELKDGIRRGRQSVQSAGTHCQASGCRCGCLQGKGQGCLSECQGCCRRLLKSSVEEWSLGCVMGSLSHTVHTLCSREVPFMSLVVLCCVMQRGHARTVNNSLNETVLKTQVRESNSWGVCYDCAASGPGGRSWDGGSNCRDSFLGRPYPFGPGERKDVFSQHCRLFMLSE